MRIRFQLALFWSTILSFPILISRKSLKAGAVVAVPINRFLSNAIPSGTCAGYLTVQATLQLPAFILAEATLSYVGLGFPDTAASWGAMLTEAADVNVMARFPWTLAPAAAIFLVTLAANLALTERSGRGGR